MDSNPLTTSSTLDNEADLVNPLAASNSRAMYDSISNDAPTSQAIASNDTRNDAGNNTHNDRAIHETVSSDAPAPYAAAFHATRNDADNDARNDTRASSSSVPDNAADGTPKPRFESSTTAFLSTIDHTRASSQTTAYDTNPDGSQNAHFTGRIFPAVIRHNTDVSVSNLHVPGEYPKPEVRKPY